ncbi:unnamed protein product [Rhizoctonia solani]|uniref:CHAT domain-containing protein n=1 Tax=Rhizoctonia solani TaxID=456999 RepID=A0A8H3DK07_9AGAM|nr:unnamed protein product [Rhizoctonia solani]
MSREPDNLDTTTERPPKPFVLISEDHPKLPILREALTTTQDHSFDIGKELDDKGINYEAIPLTLSSDDELELSDVLAGLGTFYDERYRELGEASDNDKSIEYASRALASTPDGHSKKFRILANLGTYHTVRFQRLDDPNDLGKAIGYQTRALELPPDGDINWASHLANLSLSHSHRFERLGELGDVEKAIDYGSRGLALASDAHPFRSTQLATLGISHKARFERLGELGDLDKAIEYESRALALTPDGHPDLPDRIANLGTSHGDRFQRLGELGDLHKSIDYASRAVTLTPKGDPLLSMRLTNLGIVFGDRFERLGDQDDLDKAIEYGSRALESNLDDHKHFPDQLTNLAVFYKHRFVLLEELGDLEKVIELHSAAVALTPNGHPQLSDRIHNLGVSYALRFNSLYELADLDKLITCMTRALDLTPDGHPHRPDRHFVLAPYRLFQSRHTGDPSYMQQALDSFRLAAQSSPGSPRSKFGYAEGWALFAADENGLCPMEAYQTAINVVPEFIWLGATTSQRYQDLEQVQNLGAMAAAAAIRSSDYKLALEWLEQTRCVVWSQNLMLRSPLDQLQSSHPTLAIRLQTLADQLHHAASNSRESQALSSESMTAEQVAQQHRRMAKEYQDLLSQARRLPGFEGFLQPVRANRLVRAARNGPIVILNCHEDICDALSITPNEDNIRRIPLPNFTLDKAQSARSEIERSLRRKGLRERGFKIRQDPEQKNDMGGALAMLWNDIVKPVLVYLGFLNNAPSKDLPHITWCPTGVLSFLPLHAAGDYDQPGARVFNYVVSSYTSTLTALLISTPSSLSRDSRVLAIGLQSTPNHSPLPGTAGELACVQAHSQKTAGYTQLVNDQATTTAVLDAMEQHDWVHLACHAHQNVWDPTKSGFFMHDGTLDLASINQRSFKNKGLAFLSACQTATGDEKLPNEAAHLASGMLMAGYSSVIGTMWSVMDQDAPLVAAEVYGQLVETGKLGNGEAGKALHHAAAELRGKVGEKAFERWVPYIHIGS